MQKMIETSFYQSIRKYIPSKVRKLYLIKELKNSSEKLAHYCNSKESQEVLEMAIKKKIVKNDTPIISFNGIKPKNAINVLTMDNIPSNNIDIVYCWSNDDLEQNSIDLLYSKAPNVVIDDNILLLENTKPKQHQYRGLTYILGDESHVPLHRSNDGYIDELKKMLGTDTILMEMCAGQGAIGFSLLNESKNIKRLYSVELNPNEVKQMGLTVKHNHLDESKIELVCSDALNSFPKDVKVDLVAANPPHDDRPAKTITDRQGADPEWKFHKAFLNQIPLHLNENGIITMLENANQSNPELIKSFLPKELLLYETRRIPNTPWYVVYIRKNKK